MPKVFSNLSGAYEGLRVRQLRQAGRLVLNEVINDGDPYWLVTIRKFNEERDRKLVDSLWGNGNWRFTSLEAAEAKFSELSQIPEYQAEAEKENSRRAASSLRLKERHAKGEVSRPLQLPRQRQNGSKISYSRKIRGSRNRMEHAYASGLERVRKNDPGCVLWVGTRQSSRCLPLLTNC